MTTHMMQTTSQTLTLILGEKLKQIMKMTTLSKDQGNILPLLFYNMSWSLAEDTASLMGPTAHGKYLIFIYIAGCMMITCRQLLNILCFCRNCCCCCMCT